MSVRVLLELNVKPENADDVIGFQGPDTASRNSPASCQPRAVGERHVRRAAPQSWDAKCHVAFGRHSSHSQIDRKYSNAKIPVAWPSLKAML